MTANRQLESAMRFVNFGILSKCRGIFNTCASRLSFTIIMRNPSLSYNAYPGALEITHVRLIPYCILRSTPTRYFTTVSILVHVCLRCWRRFSYNWLWIDVEGLWTMRQILLRLISTMLSAVAAWIDARNIWESPAIDYKLTNNKTFSACASSCKHVSNVCHYRHLPCLYLCQICVFRSRFPLIKPLVCKLMG